VTHDFPEQIGAQKTLRYSLVHIMGAGQIIKKQYHVRGYFEYS
jgi:hypothetical protein